MNRKAFMDRVAPVVNLKTTPNWRRIPNACYIGRPGKWGNPFIEGTHGTRMEVIAMYKRRLWKALGRGDLTLLELAILCGRPLVCHCAPLPCHGHTLREAAAWAFGELIRRKEMGIPHDVPVTKATTRNQS